MDIRQVYSPSGAVRVEQRFPRFAGFRIAKQPTFPRNKFGMSETSCWIGLFSKFVKFHLVKSGNRQGITHRHNVVQGANLSLIKRSKMRQKESTARMRRRFSALSDIYHAARMIWFCACVRWRPHTSPREWCIVCPTLILASLFLNIISKVRKSQKWRQVKKRER